MKVFAAIFLLILPSLNVLKAQPYYFRHFQVENGLSNNSVHSSIMDRNGFLWFGTKGGLNRYDGYQFKSIQLDPNNEKSLSTDVINSMLADENGNIWIGAQRGLYRYDDEKEKVTYLVDSLKEINDIYKDRHGNLWVIAGADLCKLDLEHNTSKMFPASKYFVATAICSTENGKLWVSSSDGKIYRYEENREIFEGFNVFDHSPPTPSYWITEMIYAGNHQVLIGTTSQGIKLFNTLTGAYEDLYSYNKDRSPVYVRDIIAFNSHEYWFATETGIVILDLPTRKLTNLRKKFLDPYSLNDNAIYTLTKDRDGGVWAGTYFGGVNYYSRQYSAFQKFFPDYSGNSIGGSIIREIEEDSFGNIWMGTEDAGLSKLAPDGSIQRFHATGAKTDIAYSNVHGIMARGNDLWVGTFENGLDILDIKTGKVRKHYSAGPGKYDLKENFIVSLLQSSNGTIFVGSSSALYRYLPSIDGFERVKEIPEYIFISDLMETADGTIWITTHTRGLFNYDPHKDKLVANFINDPQNKNSLSHNTVNSILEDTQGNLWISTEGGGICKLSPDKKTFRRYTMKDGLPSNFVFKSVEDLQHTIWISTAKGLVRLHPQYNNITLYTRYNGLLNDQFNYNSGFRDHEGNLYFGSVAGMIRFNPATLVNPGFEAPVYITGFQLNNRELTVQSDSTLLSKSISKTDKITLDHDQSSFSIDFAALNYSAPEITEYSYIMEGLDERETRLKSNRKVYFTDLSPGRYVFKVKAAANGVWSPNEARLEIIINPPIWATPWAFLVYVALSLVIIFRVILFYKQRTEEKKEKEIYQAKIDFFTNITHEIRTPLTLIKGPLENIRETMNKDDPIVEDVKIMERNTNRLLSLLTQILDFRKTETKGFSLQFSRVDIVSLLEEIIADYRPAAMKKKLQVTVEISEPNLFAEADEEAIHKIFSNLVNNAVKYAKEKIIIRLNKIIHEENYVELAILNDGFLIPPAMGENVFEPFFRMKETSRAKGNGIGLTLSRSLAELHQGRLFLAPTENDMNVFVLQLPLKHPGEVRKNNRTSTETIHL